MANEITLTASLTCFKPSIMSSAISRAVTNLQKNMTGTTYVQDSMQVTTTPIAIPLGLVTLPHWAFFLNLDPTNYITLMNGSGGAVFARLLPGNSPFGDCAFVPLDPTCVPFAQANMAACQLEYLILAS